MPQEALWDSSLNLTLFHDVSQPWQLYLAALLGVITAFGGLALAFAVLTTDQPSSQAVTASVLVALGGANLIASAGIRREQARALLLSVVASAGVMLYLGAGLRDWGEIFWMHGAYLLVLLAVCARAHVHARSAVA